MRVCLCLHVRKENRIYKFQIDQEKKDVAI
jgi:hypothetical protein